MRSRASVGDGPKCPRQTQRGFCISHRLPSSTLSAHGRSGLLRAMRCCLAHCQQFLLLPEHVQCVYAPRGPAGCSATATNAATDAAIWSAGATARARSSFSVLQPDHASVLCVSVGHRRTHVLCQHLRHTPVRHTRPIGEDPALQGGANGNNGGGWAGSIANAAAASAMHDVLERAVASRGWLDRVAEGFTSSIPKGEGGGHDFETADSLA